MTGEAGSGGVNADVPAGESPRKALILDTVDDLVTGLLDYDRKEGGELPRGSIEAAIAAGEITAQDIVDRFAEALRQGITQEEGL